ncbi:unnamed protein product [Moneuplotes crassus]|uniref:Uncharacterized protein n=2 Tax=Euplotes crassus TaxID=5936 RepID=A0AAD1Y7G7_EUPCR|nr:unnamed protein product [Moneuplotes crassus]
MAEHPDIKYLKENEITPILMKGMAETYKSQPNNPVKFLAKWLINYNMASVKEDQMKDEEKKAQAKQEQHKKDLKKEEVKNQEIEKEKEEKQKQIGSFHKKYRESDDLEDHLQELSDFVSENTNATTVYIGKLAKPKKKIEDESDDKAHIDEEALEQIEIIHASPKDFEFLVGKTIKANEGVTHRLFGTSAEGEGEEEEPAPAEEGEGEGDKEENTDPKHLFIEQVVREKRMKFFKVPRLGSYLAIRLSYQSCMSEKAIEEAIADKIEVDRKREEQEAEKKELEDNNSGKEGEDDEDEGEGREWEEIKEKDYLVSEQKYVVCIDTMGQDRTLDEKQIRFAIDVVKDYSENWEKTEKENLRKDIEKKVDAGRKDKEYFENESANIQNDEEKYIDDMLALREDLETDEERDKESKVYKFQFYTRFVSGLTTEAESADEESASSKPPTAKGKDRKDDKKAKKDPKKAKPEPPKKEETKEETKDEEGEGEAEPEKPIEPRLDKHNVRWRSEILALKESKTICFPRIFQTIFYLLGYTREQICEVNTNKLDWKKAKELIDDNFFMKLFKYQPVGPKDGEYKPYQKINFLEKQVEDIEQEQVEAYSHTFVRLLEWVKLAMSVRREDVVKRILNTQRLKEERARAQEQEEERQVERKAFFEEEKAKWDEEQEKKREAEEERKKRELEEKLEDEEDEFDDYNDEEAEGEDKGEGDAEGEDHGEGAAGEGEDDEDDKFDENEVYERFDEDREPIPIPPEVIDDIDNDIDITLEDIEEKQDE